MNHGTNDRRVAPQPAPEAQAARLAHPARIAQARRTETTMSTYRMSRRAMLRGLGVTMALPWMESLRVWGDEPAPSTPAKSSEPASEAPTRLAVLFAGCGFHSREWWAEGQGASMKLGRVLEPLADFRDRMVFVRGLYNAEALKGNIHSSQTGNLLSGAPLASGGKIRTGTSFDQVVAQHVGRETKLPSLVLGCEKSNPTVHKNYSMLYSSHISWSSPTTPTPLEVYPALAFDQLFKDGAEAGDRSVLDAVLRDASDVRRGLSRRDQRKLDEYLHSVREVEQRVERAGKRGEIQGWRPTRTEPDMPRPKDGYPQDIVEHMRLMSDLLVLAFQTDATRVTTLKLNNDHGTLRFPHLGVDYMIHHLLSHTDSDDWLRVNQFFLEQVAYMAKRLDEIEEGERSALDNSIILLCSSMLTGNHDATQLPVVVLGGGGGGIRGGQNLDYLGQEDRQMCRLYLSLMRHMGVELDAFGDATRPLAEV